MRPIDADALMEKYGEPCHSFADVIENMPTLDYVPRQQWISVKDGLPEMFTDVMVYTDRYGGRIEFAHIGIQGWIHNGAILIPNVTHWMPLPELPKEG